MKVNDEYRIQTEESAAWTDEFMAQRVLLSNDVHRVDTERTDRIRARAGTLVKKIALTQGEVKAPRALQLTFDTILPTDSDRRIYVWVRDGWSIDENSCRADARQAGNLSPAVYVFLPRRSADDLRSNIIDFKAANATLEKRGMPNTPEGIEAYASIETIYRTADARINELLDDVFAGAHVFQAGGAEVLGANLPEMLADAATSALARLYTEFRVADAAGWDTVYSRAQKGAPDALKAVGDDGDPANNPVGKRVLSYLGSGKSGADVREHFESAPFGWSRDTVDGALQVLLIAGLIRALDDRGQLADARNLERKAIGRTLYKIEAATVSAVQRIQIRKLLLQADIKAAPNEEPQAVAAFLATLDNLASRAGGAPPKPGLPPLISLDEIRSAAGNEQLLALYNQRDELGQTITDWTRIAQAIEARWPAWQSLQSLVAHATSLPDAPVIQAQVDDIVQYRRLLDDPDLVTPLLDRVAQLLREQLNLLKSEYDAAYAAGEQRLNGDSNWVQLDASQQETLCQRHRITAADRPDIHVSTTGAILATLDVMPLSAIADRTDALTGRFAQALKDAERLVEPETKFVRLPRRTLKTAQDVDDWLNEVEEQLKAAITAGPVSIQ